ncbi:MAG: hypothetical protein HY335_06920 [Deinococcus sp.]|nr:hypothetical protein [Deinococcus sp.]
MSYRIDIQIPRRGDFKRLITLPRLRAPVHEHDGQHYWEISKAGYALRRVLGDMRAAGFQVVKTYRVFENPYHRFFVLRKQDRGRAAGT